MCACHSQSQTREQAAVVVLAQPAVREVTPLPAYVVSQKVEIPALQFQLLQNIMKAPLHSHHQLQHQQLQQQAALN